ncbi:RNA-binding protein 15-like [Synchiropus picturatus]
MKGREQSPVKKRTRAPEDSRDRGGSSRKPGALLAVNGSGSSRRSLHHDKRDMRESDGHSSSSRSGGSYDYGMKSNGGADVTSSRSDSRPPPNSECEYRTLKISGLGTQLSDEEVEDGLFHEFSKYGDVSVKISRENDQRVAFVNFRRPEDARAGKHARGKLVLYDRPLQIDPVYDRRRSRSPVFSAGHRHIVAPHRPLSPSGAGYRDLRLQQMAMGRIPAPAPHHRDLDRERDFPCDSRSRSHFEPAAFHDEDVVSPEVDQRANRTLFLGNLDVRVTEEELKRTFDRFGVITEVDIKRAARGQTTNYGFIKFENLDMAHRAKIAMAGKVLGRNQIKIGYGKPTPTTRLWVGGLGPWVSLATLHKEFDRFGTIRTIDYRKGDMWAYIQYESLDASQAACANMRGFPLGGSERRIRVDFADSEQRYHHNQQQPPLPPFMQLPLPLPPYDLIPPSYGHRLTDSVPERPPSFPGRFRDRDIYPPAEWSGPGIHDRIRGGYDLLDHNERPSYSWAESEHELRNRAFNHKRRPLEEGWHGDQSPDYGRRRHDRSMDRSSGGSSRDGGRYSDPDRQPSSGKNSPVGERPSKDSGVKKRRTMSPSSPEPGSDKRRKARDGVKSPAKRESDSEGQMLSQVWQGALLLKNSSFPTALHMLDGSLGVAKSLLVEGSTGGQVSQLKITQRLRMDQSKLEEVSRRIKAASSSGYSILLAVPGKSEEESSAEGGNSSERPLKNLVLYLKQKEAAGIISLPVGGCRDKEQAGVLHAFPPCEFSLQFLDDSAKSFIKSEEDYMVMVIVSGAP